SKKSRTTGHQTKTTAQEDTSIDSVFGQFLHEAGVILRQGSTSNEIAVDQVVFQKRLQQRLKKSPRYPSIVQEFITGLESHIEDPERFRNCLLPCVPRLADGDSSSFQESLLRMLLGIEMLQVLVINTLFEKLPEFIAGEDGLNIPRVIVNQLKWLDRIIDSKELAGKLMQLVSVASVEIQCDIITSLPEILEDSQHSDIARELNTLLQENTQLTVPILDAFSSLNLSSTLLAEVRVSVMATLSAVQLEDLPVVVKFILHSISSSDALEVRALPLVGFYIYSYSKWQGCFWSHFSIRSSNTSASSSSQDSVALVLDGIKSAVRFQKTTSEAWLKVGRIGNSTSVISTYEVKMSCVTEVLIGYFPSILALAQSLLRSPDPCVVPFGGHMYRLSFTAFDSYCQQEVVGSLVTHVCSGVGGEVDVALELLCGLVTEKPSEMALYAVFVKGILDYMENLTPQQIRRLFHLLSGLAFGQQQQGTHIQDDMHIVVRKQLSSTVPKYKRIGIIGAVMVVGSMGLLVETMPLIFPLSGETYCVTALLELVRSCSESSPEAAALYYDELANLVLTCTLDPLVQVCLPSNNLPSSLPPLVCPRSVPFPACMMYNLDDEESQGGIAINLLQLLSDDLQHKGELWSQTGNNKTQRRVSPLCLSPFFRLLRLCEEQQHQGDLEEIDALLGCPLILTDMDVVEKSESLSRPEREFLCGLLFQTINWFREVVNAFCSQKDPEMKMKVVTRLQNITYLQTLLERTLAATPGYAPPLANFDGESTEGAPVSSSSAAPKKGKKGKTLFTREFNYIFLVFLLPLQDDAEKEKVQEATRPGVSLVSYRHFFRELDMEVLSVLQCGLLSRSLLDSELHSKVREEVQLGPAELVFLLEDMWRKLEFSLTAAPAKRVPFFKGKTDKSVGFSHLQQKSPKDIAACCVQLLPTLCTHLENCHNHFQTLLAENQGVVDASGLDVREHQLLSSAYQLLLQVLHITFSWSGFSQPEHRGLLKKTLGVLADRLKEGGPELTMDQHSFEYLLNFHSTVPSLSIALCLSQLLSTVFSIERSLPLATLARRFLCQEWVTTSGDREKGPKHNETLQTLLSIYLEHTDDVLKAVEEIAGEGIPELLNSAKDASSRTWPTLNRLTFLVFYKGMMGVLEKYLCVIFKGTLLTLCCVQVMSEKLLTWNLAVRDFHILVNLVKVFDNRPVLNVCLKYGRLFLESFLKLGMPLLDFSFKKHKEDVQSLLKTFQLSTRQLHHMCGHSKIRQDTILTNHVPALKKSLEQFVYRVKAMLTLNHCQEAFWLGNLKNRDLKGEEILSQRSQGSDEEEEAGSPLPQEQSEDEVLAIIDF
uniref:FA complementation group D2 n=1 Tax=Oncorhynchus tshawytscha TaxID=74940 RepID=A0A8C8LP22_ONCTS